MPNEQINNKAYDEIKSLLPNDIDISEYKTQICHLTFDRLSSLKRLLTYNKNKTSSEKFDIITTYLNEKKEINEKKINETKEISNETKEGKEVLNKEVIGSINKEKTSNEQIKSYPSTPEGMRKFFEEFEKGKPEKAARYLVLSNMLKYFIYDNNLDIDENGFIGSNFKVCKKDGKEHKGFTDVLNEYMTGEDYKNIIAFEAAYSSGSIENKALEIANKHNIVIPRNLDNSDKSLIRTQIKSRKEILEKEKMILFMYLDGEGKNMQKLADNYNQDVKQNLSDNASTISKLSGRDKVDLFNQKNLEAYSRNPGKLIMDVAGGMGGFLPIAIFTLIMSAFKIESKAIMYPLWALSAVGLTKGLGLGDNLGDVIGGKNWLGKEVGAGLNYVPSTYEWTKNKFFGACKETLIRAETFHYLKNYTFTNSSGIKKDVIDSDFENLYALASKSDSTDLSSKIDRSDNKEKEINDINELKKSIVSIYEEGKNKHGEENFKKVIKGATFAEVINIATDNKLPTDGKTEGKKNDPTETKPDSKDKKEDKKDSKKTEDKKPNSGGKDGKTDVNQKSKSTSDQKPEIQPVDDIKKPEIIDV